MSRSRRPEIAILVLTVLAFGLISWASLWSQEFLAAARYNPSVLPKEALGYLGAGVGPLTWMRKQPFAGIPTLTRLGRPIDASSAAESASKEVSEDSTGSTMSMTLPAPQPTVAQPTAAADAATAAPAPRPGEVADMHAHALPPASAPAPAPGIKARPADAIAPAPLPAPYMDPRWLEGAGSDLAACMRDDRDDVPATVEEVLAGELARFKVEATYHSTHPSKGGLTITTYINMERLYFLESHCASWEGPLIVAAYLPLIAGRKADLGGALKRLHEEFSRIDAKPDGCQLDLIVLSELVASEEVATMFPINTLRNVGLLLAATPLVLMMDLDMLMSGELSALVKDTRSRQFLELERLAASPAMVVVPAFETEDEQIASLSARGGKTELLKHYAAAKVQPFRVAKAAKLHGATDYNRWANATAPYEVTIDGRYEPWGIMHRAQMPMYDCRFRGYGRNKVQYTRLLNHLSYRFVVAPSPFIVHRPHQCSAACERFALEIAEERRSRGLRQPANGTRAHGTVGAEQKPIPRIAMNDMNRHRFDRMVASLKAGDYTVPVTAAFQRCRDQLPWWREGRSPH